MLRLILPMLLLALPVFAQMPVRMVTLQEVRRLAASQAPNVAIAHARSEVVHAQADQALAGFWPSLTGQIGWAGVQGATQSSSTGQFDSAAYSTSAPLLRVGWTGNPVAAWADAATTAQRALAASADTAVQARLAESEAAQRWFALAFAAARREVFAVAMTDAQALLALARTLSRLGVRPEDDIARAEAELALTQQDQLAAERDERTTAIQLAVLLRIDPALPLQAAPTATVAATTTQEQNDAWQHRPERTAALARMAAIEAEKRAAELTVLLQQSVPLFRKVGWVPIR